LRRIEKMGLSEYMDWQRYYQTEPFGHEAQWLQNALVCQAVAASGGAKTKLNDWIPKFGNDAKPLTEQEVIDKTMRIFSGQSKE
jgi:hypothetical protein